MGYFAAKFDPQIAANWTKELEMLRWIMDQPPILIMIIIFLKNLLASAMAILLGLGLGLVPLLVVTSNGFLLGIVAYGAVQKVGILYLLAGILPHGIIEIARRAPEHRHRLSAGPSPGTDHFAGEGGPVRRDAGWPFTFWRAGLRRCCSWPRPLKLLSPP